MLQHSMAAAFHIPPHMIVTPTLIVPAPVEGSACMLGSTCWALPC